MTITFTRGAEEFSPWDRIGFEAEQDAGTLLHKNLNGPPGYTLAADGPRTGTWALFFESAAEAEAARLLLVEPGAWVVVDDVAGVSMTIVRYGLMSQVQQDARLRWMLNVGFAEVLS
jgi:hypothetical protein